MSNFTLRIFIQNNDAISCFIVYNISTIQYQISAYIDMDTATSMTVINEKGQLIGGVIMPGLNLSLNSLVSGTSQLPRVSIEAPERCIGKNTVECMKSGVIYGHAAMIDGMIDRINEEASEELSVYITGGYAETVLPYCRRKMTYDKSLVLRGLELIYKKNRQ